MNKLYLRFAITLLFLFSLAVANSQNKDDVWQNVDEALICNPSNQSGLFSIKL